MLVVRHRSTFRRLRPMAIVFFQLKTVQFESNQATPLWRLRGIVTTSFSPHFLNPQSVQHTRYTNEYTCKNRHISWDRHLVLLRHHQHAGLRIPAHPSALGLKNHKQARGYGECAQSTHKLRTQACGTTRHPTHNRKCPRGTQHTHTHTHGRRDNLHTRSPLLPTPSRSGTVSHGAGPLRCCG